MRAAQRKRQGQSRMTASSRQTLLPDAGRSQLERPAGVSLFPGALAIGLCLGDSSRSPLRNSFACDRSCCLRSSRTLQLVSDGIFFGSTRANCLALTLMGCRSNLCRGARRDRTKLAKFLSFSALKADLVRLASGFSDALRLRTPELPLVRHWNRLQEPPSARLKRWRRGPT